MRDRLTKTYLPHFIAIGIGVEDFWHMTMKELNLYLLADNERKERENFNAWLNGFYFLRALQVALAQSLSGDKKAKYFNEPIRLTPYTEEEKLEIAEKERQKAIAFFDAMERSFKEKDDGRD